MRREKLPNGGSIERIDENAHEEQIKASNAMVKVMQRQARLFGLDLEVAMKAQGHKGMYDVNQMYLWITEHIANVPGAPVKECEIKLELTSGIEGI